MGTLCSVLEYPWEGEDDEWFSNLGGIWSLSFISYDILGKSLNRSKPQFSHLQNGIIIEGGSGTRKAIKKGCNKCNWKLLLPHAIVISLPLKWALFTKMVVVVIFEKRLCCLGKPKVGPSNNSPPVVVRHCLYSWHVLGTEMTFRMRWVFVLLRMILTSQVRMVKIRSLNLMLILVEMKFFGLNHVTQKGRFILNWFWIDSVLQLAVKPGVCDGSMEKRNVRLHQACPPTKPLSIQASLLTILDLQLFNMSI